VPGVFSAGDINEKHYRQITTAMADGTVAALAAERYIRS
jgi:thioredoxin reductase (NADPH)